MIAQTTKNGNTVRLSADFWIDVGKVYYEVYSNGTRFTFEDFAPAANVYKRLSFALENNPTGYAQVLIKLTESARMMGYTVSESGFCAKEVR